MRLACLGLAGVLLLCGCRAEIDGSTSPPATFGAIARPLLGCPTLDGVYAWPPVEGRLSPIPERGQANRAYARLGGWVLSAAAYVWFQPSQAGHIGVGWQPKRAANERAAARGHEWKYMKTSRADYSCADGWMESREEPHTHPGAREWFGGTVLVATKTARLEGGDLVVGQRVRVTDRTTSLFAWGDVHRGSVPQPDRVFYYWARLRRVADDGAAMNADAAGGG